MQVNLAAIVAGVLATHVVFSLASCRREAEKASMRSPSRAIVQRVTLLFVLVAAVISSCRLPGMCYRGLNIDMPVEVQFLGIGLAYAALLVYVWAHLSLAVYGAGAGGAGGDGESPASPSAAAAAAAGGGLVTSGPYAACRHPQLAASLALIAALLLATGEGLVVCALLVLWGYVAARLPGEERELYAMYGERFLSYRAATGMFVPGVCAGGRTGGLLPGVVYALPADSESLPLAASNCVFKQQQPMRGAQSSLL